MEWVPFGFHCREQKDGTTTDHSEEIPELLAYSIFSRKRKIKQYLSQCLRVESKIFYALEL